MTTAKKDTHVSGGESGERGEAPADNKVKDEPTKVKGSGIDPDHAAGYPTNADLHTNDEGKPVWGLPVGPEFDKSFPTYEYDDPA